MTSQSSKSATAVAQKPAAPTMSLKPKQAAQFLGVSVSFLAKRRVAGDGPIYGKFGGAVRYELSSLQQWRTDKQRTSTRGS